MGRDVWTQASDNIVQKGKRGEESPAGKGGSGIKLKKRVSRSGRGLGKDRNT